MTDYPQKKVLIVCRKPPYGNSLSREALDIALAGAAFGQDLALLFIDDGVLQLLKDQQSQLVSSKNHGKAISALSIYDIEQIYIDSEAMDKRYLREQDLLISAQLLNPPAITKLLAKFDIILSF